MGMYKGVLGGVESMASRFVPWHGLSETKVLVEHQMVDVDEAFTLAGLNWTVREESLAKFMPSHPLADEHKLVIREDNDAILGIGSSRYGLIQQSVMKLLVRPILEFRPDAHIEALGALFEGKVVWCLVRLDDEAVSFGSGGTEQHFRYLLFYTSHDGSKPLACRFTNVRVECMNTFSMAFGKASQLVQTIRHTSNATQYAIQAQQAVKAAITTFGLMDMEIAALLTQPMALVEALETFQKVLGERPDTGRALTMWDKAYDGIIAEYDADFNANIRNSAWGAVMAVNGYELWGQTARGQSTAQKQMRHLLDGQYKMTTKALTLVGANN